ncbi:MAG: glycosyltransferase family 2 protein [Proteobacteria bacterium]|nr:MAG: glycosyltransferase family 2 protein [Pseudomonadota bacterium]
MSLAILMATYNGEPFISEQIKSLQQQSFQDWTLFVRDDGSSDRTRDLVSAFAADDLRIKLLPEHNNLRVTQNFFRLLEVAEGYDFYAFCDQDDWWLESKLSDAVGILQAKDAKIPRLYFARLTIANEVLHPIGASPIPKIMSFDNALSQNVVTGCTVVINATGRELVLRAPRNDSRIWSHDWWFYLVISRFGELSYNPKPGILYRQHAQNLMGSKQNPLAQFVHRLRSASVQKLEARRPSKLVEAFLDVYGSQLDNVDRRFMTKLCDRSLGLWGRMRLALSGRWVRQSFMDTVILRLRVLLGHY